MPTLTYNRFELTYNESPLDSADALAACYLEKTIEDNRTISIPSLNIQFKKDPKCAGREKSCKSVIVERIKR